MDLRKFISKDEPVFIGYIHGLCHKYFAREELKQHIRNCQNGWKDNVKESGIKLKLNGREFPPEFIADL